jgi:hypothetical protein
MESIPQSVLSKIRKMMYHFLWNGHKDTNHVHLCRWDLLSRPNKNGGWGFRNLVLFNKALNVNTLWRVLSQQGIWNLVLRNKYLQNSTVINWYRLGNHKVRAASRMWTSLVQSVHIILHWLSWSPVLGHYINIGRDQILGLGSKSYLSEELLAQLTLKRVMVLAQVSVAHDPVTSSETWISNTELGLSGSLASEWEVYCNNLNQAGVSLMVGADSLLWTGGGFLR